MASVQSIGTDDAPSEHSSDVTLEIGHVLFIDIVGYSPLIASCRGCLTWPALDTFILTGTFLVFFSLIEVLVTTILDNRQQTDRAKKIDRYCRVIVPVIFVIASAAIFAKPRD
jgi:branched-subunit amino acid permease